jgi:hypothetical protein
MARWHLRTASSLHKRTRKLHPLASCCAQLTVDTSQRLARSVNHEDERYHPTIPQVVFYQSGIGTERNLYSEYVEGAEIFPVLGIMLFFLRSYAAQELPETL